MATDQYLKLLLIRHGQSMGNRVGRMEGQTSSALTALGCQQARRLRQHLYQCSEVPSCCYTSPLLRTVQTAAMFCAPAPDGNGSMPPIVRDANLQEIHPGILQGLTWAEAMVCHPDLCQQLCTQLTLVPIPGAESPQAARQRAETWLAACLGRHGAGETVWAVSHAGFLQHLVAVVLGCDRTGQITIPHTAVFEFWLAGSSDPDVDGLNPERWKIKQFNIVP